ncbi:MAG: HD domain-containing protein, partial [Desulfobacula sp.]|nr:HD domain-containing protein [Desulfobacula sp.]
DVKTVESIDHFIAERNNQTSRNLDDLYHSFREVEESLNKLYCVSYHPGFGKERGALRAEKTRIRSNICNEKIDILKKEFKTLSHINSTKKILDQSLVDQLEKIYEKSSNFSGIDVPYLTEDEFENLCILKGTLTSKERDILNSHAHLTEKILNKLPWPKKLANIPSIAGAHHEKLDGSGYPLHLNKENLNIQARILAIADIFEALSAKDRPYKEPMTLSGTVKVLEQMGENGLIDKDIIKIFFKSKAHLEYSKNHLSQSQIDL